MYNALNILQWELQDALSAGATKAYVADLRRAIMLINANLFHQKIMGADPTNQFYNAAKA
jgi:hypothetical protein